MSAAEGKQPRETERKVEVGAQLAQAAPLKLYLYAGQAVHERSPEAAYVPAKHCVQDGVGNTLSLQYPAAHTHVEPEPIECALQEAQTVLDVPVQELETNCEEPQVEQLVQLLAPLAEYAPAGHNEQIVSVEAVQALVT